MNLQGFKSELKNLATMMGELEENPSPTKGSVSNSKVSPIAPSSNPTSSSVNQSLVPQPNTTAPLATMPSSLGALGSGFPVGLGQPMNDPSLPLFNAALNSAPMVTDLRSLIDARSWTMIQEVKNHFNLSSEHEAIRLLVAMGYQKMRSQF
jgi:hypothetical protein